MHPISLRFVLHALSIATLTVLLSWGLCACEKTPDEAADDAPPQPTASGRHIDPPVVAPSSAPMPMTEHVLTLEHRRIRERDAAVSGALPTFSDTGVQVRETVEPLVLHRLDGSPVALSETWKNGLALLVLGSITCPVSRDNCEPVDAIRHDFGADLEVFVIYTIEAHPQGSASPYSGDEWITERNYTDGVLVEQPATLEERLVLAREYARRQKIQTTLLVDAMDNRVWNHLGPGPNSAVLVDASGTVLARHGWLNPHRLHGTLKIRFAKQAREALRALASTHGVTGSELRALVQGSEYKGIEQLLRKEPRLVDLDLGYVGRSRPPGTTALHLAAYRSDSEMTRFLLARKAQVDIRDRRGQTPLHIAVTAKGTTGSTSAIDIVDALTKDSAHRHVLHAYDQHGTTPLHVAVLEGNLEIARLLLERGAAPDIRTAAGMGDVQSVERYLRQLQLTKVYLKRDGGEALSYAAVNGQTEILSLLHRYGALPDQRVRGALPLQYAVERRQVKAVEHLLQHGASADISMGRYLGRPLHVAARGGAADLVEAILRHGADPDALDADGRTPMHLAAWAGHDEVVRRLIEHGGNVNARSGSKAGRPCGPMFSAEDRRPLLETPLHEAMITGQLEVVAVLLQHDADASLTERNGKTPSDVLPEALRADARKRFGELPTSSGSR